MSVRGDANVKSAAPRLTGRGSIEVPEDPIDLECRRHDCREFNAVRMAVPWVGFPHPSTMFGRISPANRPSIKTGFARGLERFSMGVALGPRGRARLEDVDIVIDTDGGMALHPRREARASGSSPEADPEAIEDRWLLARHNWTTSGLIRPA